MAIIVFGLRHPTVYSLPTEWYLQLNPLIGIIVSISARSMLISALLVGLIFIVVTIVFGRVFCGFFCPLGALIDLSDRFLFGGRKAQRRMPPRGLHMLKYVLLIALLIIALLGMLFPLFMDPLSLMTRFTTLILSPAAEKIGYVTTNTLVETLARFSPDDEVAKVKNITGFMGTSGIFILLAITLIGGIFDRRFWCQYVCPSGAFFGLLSRWAIFKRRISSGNCTSCGVCAKRCCPTHAISEKDPSQTSTAECIVCGLCAEDPRMCSVFGFFGAQTKKEPVVNLQRRYVLSGIALGVAAAGPLGSLFAGSNNVCSIIRPPGAVEEMNFLSRCLACGACIRACPTRALHPVPFTEGLNRIFTPRLEASIGYCTPECRACSHVCPTNALLPVSAADKPYAKIGTGEINRQKCLAWTGKVRCLKCNNVCPYNAIQLETIVLNGQERDVPVVNEDLCTGCGKCQWVCPSYGSPAIVIKSYGARRTRPFLSEKKRARLEKLRIALNESTVD